MEGYDIHHSDPTSRISPPFAAICWLKKGDLLVGEIGQDFV